MLEGKGGTGAVRSIDRGGDLFGPCPVDVGERDLRALFRQHAADGFAKPLRAAGDQCHLS
jgi:hypothetical protein